MNKYIMKGRFFFLRCRNWDTRGSRAMLLLTRLGREWACSYARALIKVKGMPRPMRSLVRAAASSEQAPPN